MTEVVKTIPNDLKAEKQYAVRIRSLNAFGVPSDWSESIVVNTTAANLQTAQRLVVTNDGMVAYNQNGQITFNYSSNRVIRNNPIKNPSFEVNTTGWSALSNSTIARLTTDFFAADPAYGPACLKIISAPTLPATTASQVGVVQSVGDRFTVTAGLPYTITTYIRVPTGQPNIDMRLGLRFYNGGGTQIGELISITPTTVSADNNWVRLNNVAITAPSGAVTAAFVCYTDNAIISGAFYYIDAILVEQTTTIKEYFDGSTSVGTSAWAGSVHASASTLDTNSVYGVNQGLFTSQNYSYTSGNYSNSGTQINLETGLIRSKNFYIDASGNAGFVGNISGGTIDIGGDDTTSFHVDAAGNAWIGAGISGYSTAPFKVSATGELTASYFNLLGTGTYAGILMAEMGNFLTNYYGMYLHHNDSSITQESLFMWTQRTSGGGQQSLYLGAPRNGTYTANRAAMSLTTYNSYQSNQALMTSGRFGPSSPTTGGSATTIWDSSATTALLHESISIDNVTKASIQLGQANSGQIVMTANNATSVLVADSNGTYIAASALTQITSGTTTTIQAGTSMSITALSGTMGLTSSSNMTLQSSSQFYANYAGVHGVYANASAVGLQWSNTNRIYIDGSQTNIMGDTVRIANTAYSQIINLTPSTYRLDITPNAYSSYGVGIGEFWSAAGLHAANAALKVTTGSGSYALLLGAGYTNGSGVGANVVEITSGGKVTINRDHIASGGYYDYANAQLMIYGNNQASISFHVPGDAPMLRKNGSIGRIDCVNYPGTDYYTFGAEAYYTDSSIEVKKNVTPHADSPLLEKIFWAKSFDFQKKNKPQSMRPNARYREINERWMARGHKELTELVDWSAYTEMGDHDCSIDTCNGSADNPCHIQRNYDSAKVGLIAEYIFELFPSAVWVDDNNKPEGLLIEQIAGLALGSVAALTRTTTELLLRIDDLETQLNSLKNL